MNNVKPWIRATFAILYIFLGVAIFVRILSEPRTIADLIFFIVFMVPALANVDKIFMGAP